MNTPLRGRSNIKFALAPACLGVALLLGACGGGGDGGGNGTRSRALDLVIGNSLPLSGISRDLGTSGEKASALAVQQIRTAIDQTGASHTVRAVLQDQGADPAAAVDGARRLVDDRGANCLTGPWTPDAVLATANEVAIPDKVLEISPVAASEDVTDLSDHDLVDSTALPESSEGEALADAIEQGLGGAQDKSVNLAAANDTYGKTLAQDFIDSWQGRDGSVGEQVAVPARASQIMSGSPDAVLLLDDLQGFSELAPSLSHDNAWNPDIAWGGDRLVSPGLPGAAGTSAVDGMRVLAPGTPVGEGPSTAFVHAFKSAQPRTGKLPPFAAQEFDATVLCYLAAVAAGSTDGQEMADKLVDITAPGGEEFSWQQLPDAIKALEDGEDIDYTGASGPIDMDINGNPTKGVYDVYRYSAAGLQVMGEVAVSKPNPATP
jgi:branched-chain amino acid transport system substrate-binding protein